MRIFVVLIEVLLRRGLTISALILTVILIASLWPADQLPEIIGSDKAHHFISYALLMIPTVLASPKRWAWFGLFFIGVSGGIEIIQPFVNRYGEWLDLLANGLGLAVGVLIAKSLLRAYTVTLNRYLK